MSAAGERARIAVMGAGAVGCHFGAMLARAGHDVTLIGRATHVEAMRAHGLRLVSADHDGAVPVRASIDPAAVAGADLVLFCVKSTDTDTAARQIAPHVGADAVLVSLQNGVDNAERLAAHVACEVVPAVVYIAVAMTEPGVVCHSGGGEVTLASGARSDEIARMLVDAGVRASVSDNALGALWAKLVANCAVNALSAIARRPYGQMAQEGGIWAVMREALDEASSVAAAAGVTLPGGVWESVERIVATMPEQFSSTAQDLMRGRPSEIDHLNGYVVRRGAELGVPTPVNRTLHALVKLLETGDAPAAAAGRPQPKNQ